ncbi:MAG: hypothetical protein AAGD47_12105 [Pseudomonadota bacterium]
MRWLLALVLVIAALPARAEPRIEPDDIRLELFLEDRARDPFPGEMILLSIRGTYRIPVVRENLVQPPLDGFDCMQLGEDRWYHAFEDGFEVLKLERRMALFPQQAGQIEVPAFTHELEMFTRRGETIPVDQHSNTLTVTVAPQPEVEDWWFPVRGLRVSDSWSNPPEALPPGGGALRIVTLTLTGSAPQRVPPMPEMTGAGVHIFPHPVRSMTQLGPDGPITRVFWRWTLRPEDGSAGYLNPVPIPYFDSEAAAAREITLVAQRVAFAGGPQEVSEPAEPDGPETASHGTVSRGALPLPDLPRWSVPAALLAAFAIGFSGSIGRGNWRVPGWLRRDPDIAALRRAARRGDAGAVRLLGHRLLSRGGQPTPRELAALDRALYGPGGARPSPRKAAREVLAALRRRVRE